MQICMVQREGSRHISRFRNLPETDRLEVEITIEDKGGRVIRLDLTEALLAEYARCQELGQPRPEPADPLEDPARAAAREIRQAGRSRRAAKVIEAMPLNELDRTAPREPARRKHASKKKAAASLAKEKPVGTGRSQETAAGKASSKPRQAARGAGAVRGRINGGKKNGKSAAMPAASTRAKDGRF